MIYHHPTVKGRPDPVLYAIVQQIDRLVERCAEEAYHLAAMNMSRPFQALWKNAAESYLNGDQSEAGFLAARYGYAIEDLVNTRIRLEVQLSDGYRIDLQVVHEHTRPDIVVSKGRTEVAWLDITSKDSRNHINKKDGSGWRTMDFVAELCYKPLEMRKVLVSDDDTIATRVKTESVIRRNSAYERCLSEYFVLKMTKVLGWVRNSRCGVNQARFATRIEQTFGVRFPSNDKHAAIKSMLLEFLDQNDRADYDQYARQVLHDLYQGGGQNLGKARQFISISYEKYADM